MEQGGDIISLRTVNFDLPDPPPSVSSSSPFCGNAILSRDPPYTISFSRSYTHCLVVCFSMHSSPIVISCHCPFQSAVHTSIQSPSSDDSPHFHSSCSQVLFYSSPYHIPFISVTCVPVAIYLLGPRRLPKHLFKYIISGILLHLYISLPFSSFWRISFIPRCYHQLSSYTIIHFQSLTGIAPTHLFTCLSLHQSQ
jgi:hypothetical protein